MKITIYGAGSSYTPEIFRELSGRQDIHVDEVALFDIDPVRLAIQEGFCTRYAKRLGLNVKIYGTLDVANALKDADFVITQYRVGGNKARINDEKIPLKYGYIGQETTGPGGMMKALRTVPVAVALGNAVAQYCPRAWVVNYTNPSGMVTEGMLAFTDARAIGLCAGGTRPGIAAAKALGVDRSAIRYDFFGLNHMNFAYNITVNGESVDPQSLVPSLKESGNELGAMFMEKWGLYPSSYCVYYFNTSARLRAMQEAQQSRAEIILGLEDAIFAAYADPDNDQSPPELQKRGGGGYSEVAIGLLGALANNKPTWMVCNVPNQGIIPHLPDVAVIETACYVDGDGARPLPFRSFPKEVWGIATMVKNYEQLAIEAAMTGSRDTALAALCAHPLVREIDRAEPMLEELLEANREYLPAFFKS